jgi:acyl-[acyl-carrier-protein]-phospholipid O-acyltransferase/long-chain-fatty-acid--[acyl-carrier-protein] ligase
VLPFFHSFGYTVTLWAPLQIGASTVYHTDPRAAREIGELCRTYGCTLYLSTATFLRFCLKKCGPGDFATLRLLICGAEKLPTSLSQDFAKRFGVVPLEGYGTTELSPACNANLSDRAVNGVVEVRNRPGTIGPPLPGNAVRIADPETLEALPVGQEGLVLVSGANVMKGYLHKPELSAQALRDGWYVTGDVGRVDPDGFATLTGRLSRFAKVGGEMVPLEKVEEELHEALETTERVCAVTCVPDEVRGERLVVLHVPAEGLEVRAWCGKLVGRGLPNLWLPAERDFYPVAELPLLGSGKVNLKAVKEMALALARRGVA